MVRISCSSSLHNGCDEPEILRCENLKSVPQAMTSDMVKLRRKLYAIRRKEPDITDCRIFCLIACFIVISRHYFQLSDDMIAKFVAHVP